MQEVNMKKYTLSFGQSLGYNHPFPERTAASSGASRDRKITYQVWPNRESMARSIRMQQQRASKSTDWKAVVRLKDTEGY